MNAALGPAVVSIDSAAGTEESLELDPARLATGSPMPEQFVRNAYTDASGRFFAGLWRSSVGAWRVSYTENELCVLTAGRIRITDDHGRQWTYGPGDSFLGCGKSSSPPRRFTPSTSPPRAEPTGCVETLRCASPVHRPGRTPRQHRRIRMARFLHCRMPNRGAWAPVLKTCCSCYTCGHDP